MFGGIVNLFRRLFGLRLDKAVNNKNETSCLYKGYTIYAKPQKEGVQWLTAGVISKTDDMIVKEHKFVRADFHSNRDTAIEFSISKGQQIIDLEGEKIFK
ncbi:MAG: HlyU family transcriptional regulator [Alphaproteobacteria bacterium]|jgi:hypothetical protein|nr:HlyU family transcriptional regulator [Alphaproteobacteria bacterium]